MKVFSRIFFALKKAVHENPRHAIAGFVGFSVFVGLMIVVVVPILAAPPTSPYAPGETLNPTCAPGAVNCTVNAPATGTGTSTQIAFWNSTTGLTSSPNFTFTSSTNILEIAGVVSSTQARIASSTISNLTVTSCIGCATGSVTTSSVITPGYVPYWVSAAGSLNGTSSIFINGSTGNVGIGTASPSSTLHVVSTLPSSPSGAVYGAKIDVTSAGSAGFSQQGLQVILNQGYTGSGATTYAGVFSNSARSTQNGNTSTGNVGVYGNADGVTTQANAGFQGWASNSSGYNFGVYGAARTATGSGQNVGGMFYGYNTGSGKQVGVFATLGDVSDRTIVNSALIADNYTEAAPIFLGRDNGTTVFQIADGGALTVSATSTFNGNVGIGTSTPADILHVVSASGEKGIRIESTGNTAGSLDAPVLQLKNGNGKTFSLEMAGIGTAFGSYINTGLFGTAGADMAFVTDPNVASGGTNTIRFGTGGSQAANVRMTIDELGNVSVGSTTSTYKLGVLSGTYNNALGVVSNDATGPGLTIKNTGTGGHEWNILSAGASASPGAGALGIFDTTSSSYRLVISANGNVGIGTASPSSTLHVVGSSTISGNVSLAGATSLFSPTQTAGASLGSGTPFLKIAGNLATGNTYSDGVVISMTPPSSPTAVTTALTVLLNPGAVGNSYNYAGIFQNTTVGNILIFQAGFITLVWDRMLLALEAKGRM